ncbi:MAG: metal-sulfur cluster assembly factor [Lentisphaeria bacterium]|nr:metal-sulfur cluster assembly factor [Lentisphaeria bacterium]
MSEETTAPKLTPDYLREVVYQVEDPDLGMSIVDLGLIYEIRVSADKVEVDMTLTSPACPYGPMLINEVDRVLREVPGVEEVDVEIVWDPPWSMDMIKEEVRLDMGLDF